MDPYAAGLARGRPVCRKREVVAELVSVHATRRDGRALALIPPQTRAVTLHSIQELVVTDERDAAPGGTVNAVAYLGFVEIVQGGVAMVGDVVTVDGRSAGVVAGFDESHSPNHCNIVLRVEERRSGFELGLEVGMKVRIAEPAGER
jgi:hypothetical protein